MLDVHEICERSIKVSNADQTEAFCINARMRNFYVENGEIKLVTDNSWVGLGVKTIVDKRIGYYGSTIKDEKDIEKIVKNSIDIAKVSPIDPNFKSLPEPREISGSIDGVYDTNLSFLEVTDVTERIDELINVAQEKEVRVMTGLLRLTEYKFNVMNSLGIDFQHQGTMVYLHFTGKKEKGEGIVKRFSTMLDKIDFGEVGNELRDKTLLASEAKSFSGKEELEVIIDPMELPGLLNVITIATNGEYINRKMSPWIGKLGEKVASENLTVIDDGRVREGLLSALADDEGVPTSRKLILEKGILKNYLFDSYNAGIYGTESTGNGLRRGTTSIENIHLSPTRCGALNVIIETGNKSFDDLISEMDKGLLIYKFAYPYADPITGNFGLEVRNAALVEHGSITISIKHAILAGNMYKALNNVTGLGRKRYNVLNYKTPYIRFGSLELVGL